MPTLALNCNNCGAPLSVPDGVRFLTCSFCQSQLEVVQEGNAAFTKVLEQLQERTEQVATDVERLKLQNQLLSLEHEWDRQSRDLMVHNKEGRPHVPTVGGAIAMLLIGGLMSAFALSIHPGMGLLFIVVIIIGATMQWTQADRYSRAKRQFELNRQRIHSEMDELYSRD